MKSKFIAMFMAAICAVLCLSMTSCQKVPAGNVGVKVYLLGGEKGVDNEVLGVGRYWIGFNEELYLYPVFQQNYVWNETSGPDKSSDESISFQTVEGLEVRADLGITYRINPEKVGELFQKFRKGVEEITDGYVRNIVRDSLNKYASQLPVEVVYGKGKQDLMDKVEADVRDQLHPFGIEVENVYLVGQFKLPTNVVEAINAKIGATQKAQQRENELQQAKAEAAKVIAAAQGDADAKLALAKAEAEANRLKAASLTPELVQYEQVMRWDGKLPTISTSSGVVPFLNVPVPEAK